MHHGQGVPQLTSSSSSERTDRTWLEQVICSMELAGGYTCSGARDTSIDEMAIPIDTATMMAMSMDDLARTSCESSNMDQEERSLKMSNTAYHGSPHWQWQSNGSAAATQYVEPPTWAENVSSYDFATLLHILTDPNRRASHLKSLRCLLQDDRWNEVFSSMTPKEYSSLIMAIDSEFDRPEIAALIAPYVNSGEFTHEYIIAVLKSVADRPREPLITKLLPLCKDVDNHAELIKAELSEWDIVYKTCLF